MNDHLPAADQYLTESDARQLYQIGDSAHDFDHVRRVAQLATRIAAAEGADPLVVQLAALLHDLPVPGAERRDHHLAAAEYAGQLLRQRGLDPERADHVAHCIAAHRFRQRTVQPATLEAQCLYDADKLESIGAIGVARVFAYAGAHGNRVWIVPASAVPPLDEKPSGGDYTPVHEYVYKLQKLIGTLHTATARPIGNQRHVRMVSFFDQLDEEMRGLA
ncbi:MAG TPA: HD domain-containing protein [Caldilineaceae bacterium]|nr:HD domain-containing protein [Caldilineaceae bacterium]